MGSLGRRLGRLERRHRIVRTPDDERRRINREVYARMTDEELEALEKVLSGSDVSEELEDFALRRFTEIREEVVSGGEL